MLSFDETPFRKILRLEAPSTCHPPKRQDHLTLEASRSKMSQAELL